MPGQSYTTTFPFKGKEIPLEFNEYWRVKPPDETEYRCVYHLYINKFYKGCLTKHPVEGWILEGAPPVTDKNRHNILFELTDRHIKRLGIILEVLIAEKGNNK